MKSFEVIDYIFLSILLFSALFGFARGFLKESFTVINIAFAATATYFTFGEAYEFFFRYINNENVVITLSTFLVFLFYYIIVVYINRLLVGKLSFLGGNFVDRLLGTAFGLFRGMLTVVIIYMATIAGTKSYSDESLMPEWLQKAKTQNFVKMQTEYFLHYMPEYVQNMYKNGTDSVIDTIYTDLSKKAPVTSFEKKIADYGLSLKNINTLRQVVSEVPFSLETPYSFTEVASLEKVEFRDYIEQLAKDHEKLAKMGKIKTEIEDKDLEDLVSAARKIEIGDGYDENGIY
jgi:membrane protein required for colicin V production